MVFTLFFFFYSLKIYHKIHQFISLYPNIYNVNNWLCKLYFTFHKKCISSQLMNIKRKISNHLFLLHKLSRASHYSNADFTTMLRKFHSSLLVTTLAFPIRQWNQLKSTLFAGTLHCLQSSILLSSTCLLAGRYTLKEKSLFGNDPWIWK